MAADVISDLEKVAPRFGLSRNEATWPACLLRASHTSFCIAETQNESHGGANAVAWDGKGWTTRQSNAAVLRKLA